MNNVTINNKALKRVYSPKGQPSIFKKIHRSSRRTIDRNMNIVYYGNFGTE
ncbi:hypothetical protein KIN20_034129 [Parelaphostrongylus tenuis]|uniref:Uncharacterized protein n=1 Tax=Parelaphostrongylus tenuis TaxID=148309 RepID=A0AAD5WJT6_PARTN|nr:hypothetical protein KIN20_034129 [Parelaphostrongylus tenuis]